MIRYASYTNSQEIFTTKTGNPMEHKGAYLTEVITYNGDTYERRTSLNGDRQWFKRDGSSRKSIDDDLESKLESKYEEIRMRYYSSLGIIEWAEGFDDKAVSDAIQDIFAGLEPED